MYKINPISGIHQEYARDWSVVTIYKNGMDNISSQQFFSEKSSKNTISGSGHAICITKTFRVKDYNSSLSGGEAYADEGGYGTGADYGEADYGDFYNYDYEREDYNDAQSTSDPQPEQPPNVGQVNFSFSVLALIY